MDADGKTAAVGDFTGQAHQVMANLVTALQAAGAQLTDGVKTTSFVASSQRADLSRVWDVVRAAFGDHDAPSTLLGVSVLGYDEQLVELERVLTVGAELVDLGSGRGVPVPRPSSSLRVMTGKWAPARRR